MAAPTLNTLPAKGFFSLPGRARDIVYDCLFPERDAVNFSSKAVHRANTRRRHPLRSFLRLLRCSTRTAREAARVLYGQTRFIVERGGVESFLGWLRKIGPHNRQLLKHLHLNLQETSILRQLPASPDEMTAIARRFLETIFLVRLKQIANLLRHTHFDILELFMNRSRFRMIEPMLQNLKVATIVLQHTTTIRPYSAIFKTMWVREVLVLARTSPSMANCRTVTLNSRKAKGKFDLAPRDFFSPLPAETRNAIYKLLLEHEYDIRPLDHACDAYINAASDRRNWDPVVEVREAMGLWRVSKKIRDETTAIFYGENVFRLLSSSPFAVTNWLQTIGPNITNLRNLRISADHMLREVRRADMPFPWLDEPDVTAMPARPLGRLMQNAMNTALQIMRDAFQATVTEASNNAAADQHSALILLQQCPLLARLDLLMPREWELERGFGAVGRGSMMLYDYGPHESFWDSLRELARLRVSTEVRIGTDKVGKRLELAVKKTRAKEAVVYAVSVEFEADPDRRFDRGRWTMAGCGMEERRWFGGRRREPVPKAEERVVRIWPAAHPMDCDADFCREMRRPE